MIGEVLLPMKAPKSRPAKEGVSGRVGMHPSTIYAEIASGNFPAPVKLGRSSRWPESEIDAWIEDRKRERNQHQDAA